MTKEFLLNTKRLNIRYFKKNDYNDLYEYLSDIKTYKYEPGKPISKDEAKKICIERAKGKAFYAVVLKTENKLIGHIYLNITEPKHLNIYEIGYIFNPAYQGKGYATESIKKLIEYKFNELNIHKITAYCSPKNKSSWKLLERLGFIREGKLRKNIYFNKNENGKPIWFDSYVYGLLKEDME